MILRKPVPMVELLAKIEQHLGVPFLYEENDTGDLGVSGYLAEEPVRTGADFLDLSRMSVSDLHRLAMRADPYRMLRKIDEIRDEDPRLARALANLVKTFHRETLLALTSMPTEQE